MATEQTTVSIRPSDFGHGGGLIDDVDALIKEARWVVYDFNGKTADTVCAHVVYTVSGDSGSEDHDSYYSIGKEGSKSFIPNKDGKSLRKIGSKDSLSDGCNFYQFISSVVNAGYDENKIDGSDISFLDGLNVHVKREAQPERKGIAKDPTDTREKTVLCISKIYDAKGAGKGKPAAAGTSKPAAAGKANGSAAAADEALDAKAADAVLTALGEAGGTLTKPKLSQALFAALKGDPDQNKVVTLAFKNDFLMAEGRPWSFNGTEVSLG